MPFLIKGLIIGFCIAAPVGPIGLLCIQRTLNYGALSGLLSGLGAASADAFYGAVAAYGLTLISNFLIGQQFWFKCIGGLFLLYLGYQTYKSKVAENCASAKHKGLLSDYFSTVFLTATNPTTILSFVAVFAGLGLANTNADYFSASMIVFGV
ncbi:MAG: LysE family transporter, partial [Candidatus Caenarcaniphilales bacterium]|nr:LysE family transporter [Candidatus Caenarcaniphilales bacterium]